MPSYDNLPQLIGRIASDVTTNGSNDIDGTRMRNLLIDTVNTLLFLLGSVPSSTIATFLPWDEGETYVGGTEVVVQDGGKLYLFVSDVNNIGTVPGTNALIWEEFSALQLAHFQDKDHALDYGGPYQVTAQEIRAYIDGLTEPIVFGFDDSTDDDTPNPGTFRLNSEVPTEATELYLSWNDLNGKGLVNYESLFQSGDLFFYSRTLTGILLAHVTSITMTDSYAKLTLSMVSGTPPTTEDRYRLFWTPNAVDGGGATEGYVNAAIAAEEAARNSAISDAIAGVDTGAGEAYVDDAIAAEETARNAAISDALDALVGSAPGTLDTLGELADALADDADFAASMTTLLALKAPVASPAFTGTPTAPTPSAGDNSTKVATTAYADGGMADHLSASDPHGTLAAVQAGVAFSNSPTAPTPTAGDNSTKLATTAFSNAAMAAHLSASDPHSDRAFFDTLTINPQTGTTYTLVLADGKATAFVTLANASAITLTVPLNSSVAFPVGTVINCSQQGAGAVTVAAAGGVTINSPGTLVTTIGKGAMFSLMKVATNEWNLYGMLQA